MLSWTLLRLLNPNVLNIPCRMWKSSFSVGRKDRISTCKRRLLEGFHGMRTFDVQEQDPSLSFRIFISDVFCFEVETRPDHVPTPFRCSCLVHSNGIHNRIERRLLCKVRNEEANPRGPGKDRMTSWSRHSSLFLYLVKTCMEIDGQRMVHGERNDDAPPTSSIRCREQRHLR